MRIISLLLLSLSLYCYSGVSSASTLTWWDSTLTNTRHPDYQTACIDYGMPPSGYSWKFTFKTVNGKPAVECDYRRQVAPNNVILGGQVTQLSEICQFGDNGSQCNTSCEAPSTMVDGQCVAPTNECAAKTDQPTNYFKEYDSYEAYQQNPIYCSTSQGGCSVNVCADNGSLDCGTSGKTGKFACWGSGTYDGEQLDPTDGSGVSDCAAPCTPPKPSTTDSSNSCTTPVVSNGVTSYSCMTESNSEQFASSNCAVGEVNGVTALHCTSPDYVPESDSHVKEDDIEQTTNPDGGSTTVTDTTTTDTHCKAGECTTSTSGSTTTTTKDPNGNTTGESSQCTGDHCDNPTTPEDESEEEEKEEGIEREVTGEDCSAGLLCAGDAIDCAVLRQLKEQRCSMDWNKHKSAVLAEAGKSEYQLGTDEIDASDLFSGPSAGRWLSPTCPADRVINLATTGTSITFSWSFVCQYASGLGNLLVALASLFFAVYVGRAFGGD